MGASALAEPPGEGSARAQAWLDGAVNLRESLRSGQGGVRLDYSVEYRYVPPAAEIEALRRAVAGHPEHPQRAWLGGIERRLRGEIPTRAYVTWLWGRDFRCSMTQEGDSGVMLDAVITPNAAWAMNKGTLHVADSSSSLSIGFNSVEAFEVDLADAMMLLSGGLEEARQRGIALRVVPAPAGRWAASGVREGGGEHVELRASGAWDDALGAATVEEVLVTATAERKPRDMTRYLARGWRVEPGLGRLIAGEVERRFGDQSDRRVRLVGVAALDRREFERVTAVPAVDGVDVIRGPATFRAVVDNRSGRSQVFAVADGRDSLVPAGGRTPQAARSDLRTVGWVLAGCIAAALVLLRVRERSRVKARSAAGHE